MGQVLKTFKKDAVKTFITSVANGDIKVHAFVSGVSSISNTVNENYDDSVFRVQREMMFGKQLSTTGAYDSITANNFAVLARRIDWANNTVYDYYDNTDSNIFDSNTNFYVVSHTSITGQTKDVYKCIWNNNGANSTVDPSVAQSSTPVGGQFTTSDGYNWLYMYSISASDWNKFGFSNYIPVFSNTISSSAATDGVPFIKVNNGGSGYTTKSGNVLSATTNTVIQIGTVSTVSSNLNQYANSYLLITIDPAHNNSNVYLSRITTSYVNSVAGSGYVFAEITPGIPDIAELIPNYSTFVIGPHVQIAGDGTGATAFANVSSSGSIDYITIKNTGSGYTRATATIYNQTTSGSGATATALVAPPGGHGFDPFQELGASALGVYSQFVNNDVNFVANVTYNTIGILANPKPKESSVNVFSNGSFSQIMTVNLTSNALFLTNEALLTSNNHTVYFLRTASDSTSAYLVGDRSITNGETITGVTSGNVNTITEVLNTGMLNPYKSEILYINNLTNGITRTVSSNEEVKLAIQF